MPFILHQKMIPEDKMLLGMLKSQLILTWIYINIFTKMDYTRRKFLKSLGVSIDTNIYIYIAEK